MTDSESSSGGAVIGASLIENMRKMIRDRSLAEHQLIGDLAIALARDREAKHLNLACRESRR